jgi:DNA-binding MarR family transcriptional regulator
MGMGTNLDLPASTGDLDRPVADDPDIFGELACTNTALRRAARRLGQLYDETLAPLGLKATQVGLISEIERCAAGGSEEGPTLQELAGRLAIQISALTHALKPLVRDGLVELRPDTVDRRTKHGVLTPLGKERLSEAFVLWAKANNRVESVLGRDSAATLRALADKVASVEFLAAFGTGNSLPADADHI